MRHMHRFLEFLRRGREEEIEGIITGINQISSHLTIMRICGKRRFRKKESPFEGEVYFFARVGQERKGRGAILHSRKRGIIFEDVHQELYF